MIDAVLQAIETAEERAGQRIAMTMREMSGSLPTLRKTSVPVIVAEGRFGAYYDALQTLAKADPTTRKVFEHLAAQNKHLDPEHLMVAFVAIERFRSTYAKWLEAVLIGGAEPLSSRVSVVAMVLGTADALRVALELPADPYVGLPENQHQAEVRQ